METTGQRVARVKRVWPVVFIFTCVHVLTGCAEQKKSLESRSIQLCIRARRGVLRTHYVQLVVRRG